MPGKLSIHGPEWQRMSRVVNVGTNYSTETSPSAPVKYQNQDDDGKVERSTEEKSLTVKTIQEGRGNFWTTGALLLRIVSPAE